MITHRGPSRPKKRPVGVSESEAAPKQEPIKFPFHEAAKQTMRGLVDLCDFRQVLFHMRSPTDFTGAVLVAADYDLAEVAAFFYDPVVPGDTHQLAERLTKAGAIVWQVEAKPHIIGPMEWVDCIALAPFFLVKKRGTSEDKRSSSV